MHDPMVFVSAKTTSKDVEAAVASLVEQISAQALLSLGEEPPPGWLNLAIAFVSTHFTHATRLIQQGIQSGLQPQTSIGCTAEAVIGRDEEIEGVPAITLVAAHLPGVVISPFFLQPTQTDWPMLLLDGAEFRRVVDAPPDTRLFVLVGDPFSTPMDDVLEAFNTNYPGIPVVGGMASGALRPQGNGLWLGDQITNEGAVGLALAGGLDVDVIVSQGCRPIWRPFQVTSAHRNMIFNLDGRSPLAWIQDLILELSEEERSLLQNGLFVGRSIRSGREGSGRGDFLIRGVVGIDQESGAIAIGDSIMDGETVQFHLRDAMAATEDLEMMLIPQAFRQPPSGALLFSCNGRGLRLYDHPNGDITVVQANLQGTHLAGFFCAGEIGPIGGTNFLHGHTASLVIFRPLQA